jgi:hypothetical protein
LSAKKSSLVNWKLFFAPSTSQKKGSLRQPAKKRVSAASVTLASRPLKQAPLQDHPSAIAGTGGLLAKES